MGINYQLFSGSSTLTQKESVLSWFQENGTEYFDSITTDDLGTISLTINGALAIKIGFTVGSSRCRIYASDDDSTPVYESTATAVNRYFRSAATTPYGIVIFYMPADGSGSRWESLWITKTNNGDVAIVALISTSTGAQFAVGDFSQGSYTTIYSSTTLTDSNFASFMRTINSNFTSLSPIGIENSNQCVYLPNMFMFRFSTNTQGNPFFKRLTLNGYEYFTDGYLALFAGEASTD